MSLLKRIERARPAAEGEATPNVPAAPAPVQPPGGGMQPPVATGGGAPVPPPPAAASRFSGAMPARESFREGVESVVEHDAKVTLLAERWDPRDAGLMW